MNVDLNFDSVSLSPVNLPDVKSEVSCIINDFTYLEILYNVSLPASYVLLPAS